VKPSHRTIAATGLSACVFGLALCPYVYVAIGALAGFGLAFSFLTLPPLAASTALLLYCFLSKPSGQRTRLRLELICFSVVIAFLVLVSGFSLHTTLERIGLSASVFLASSALCLPVVLVRRTALQQRVESLPVLAVRLTLIAILTVASAAAVAFSFAEPAFI
jgi:Na+-transporting NADH:ubiquinone oxidoreductase subunit NqrE